MRTISFRVEDLKKVIIELGFVAENEHTRVIIDCTKVFAEYPEAVPTMKVQPPRGTAYPRNVTRDGNCVIWDVKDSDLAERGRGEIQLTFTNGTKICKSYIGKTNINRSIQGSGTVPSPVQDWIDEASDVLDNLEDAEVNQPVIGEDGYWYTWDQENGEYVKTDTKAQGEDGDPGQPGTDATPDLITVPYEDLTFPVTAGTQCYHGGKLYQANQAIQSSEQWTAAHWTETTVEAQITDVKNAIRLLDDSVFGDPHSDILGLISAYSNGTSGGITYTRNTNTNIVTASGTRSGTSFRLIKGNGGSFPSGFAAGNKYKLEFVSSSPLLGVKIFFYKSGSEYKNVLFNESDEFVIPVDADDIAIRFEVSSGWPANGTGTITFPKIYLANNPGIESDVVELQDEVDAIANRGKEIAIPYYRAYKFNASVNGNTVGGQLTLATSNDRVVNRIKVDKSVIAVLIKYAVSSGETVCAVVTDKNGKVLETVAGSNTKPSKIRISIKDIPNAVYVYWTMTQSTVWPAYAVIDDGGFVLSEGTKIGYVSSDGTAFPENIDSGKAIKLELSTGSSVSGDFVLEKSMTGITYGIWIKMPYFQEVKGTDTITFNFYNENVSLYTLSFKANILQLGEWVFVKRAFNNNSDSKITKFNVSATFESGYTDPVTVLISDHVTRNHMERPIVIINHDSFWGASERCGLYDYLINNNLPWTVTGVNNTTDPVSNEYLPTLFAAYEDGLLDVGIYSNEQPDDYPIPQTGTIKFISAKGNMEHLIEDKIDDGYNPVSFGASNNWIFPSLKRTVSVCGFKAVRGGASVVAGSANVIAKSDCCDVIYRIGSEQSAYDCGGTTILFSHGISSNPSGETNPDYYTSWTDMKNTLDEIIAMRNAGKIMVMNMKQFTEYKRSFGYPRLM